MSDIIENIIAGIIIALCAIYLVRKIWLNLRGVEKGEGCSPDSCASCPYNTEGCKPDDQKEDPKK